MSLKQTATERDILILIGIHGIPGNGRLNQLDDVIMICTCVMFTCTAQHAAVNFSQYEEFGFPPNYPALLHGQPPADKVSYRR